MLYPGKPSSQETIELEANLHCEILPLKRKNTGGWVGDKHTYMHNLNNTKRNYKISIFIINTCPNCPSAQLAKVLPLMVSR